MVLLAGTTIADNYYYFHACIAIALALMKIIAILLQKLATVYVWNVKQKDDGMDQSTLHCCYGAYVTKTSKFK